MTATTAKTAHENKHSHELDYFVIIPSCSHFRLLTKCAKKN